MKCAIMQPTYLPWMGYFALMDEVDAFVFLDNVQLVKRSWQVRNRIKSSSGDELMLSVPVRKTKTRDELMIMQGEVNDDVTWRRKHLGSFENSYRSAPFFSEAYELLVSVIGQDDIRLLGEINQQMILAVKNAIGIATKTYTASQLPVDEPDKQLRLLKLTRHLDCDTYVSPPGSADYIEHNNPGGIFAGSGVELQYQDYSHPEYDQINGDFLPFMCILDLIANVGCDDALAIIRSGRADVK